MVPRINYKQQEILITNTCPNKYCKGKELKVFIDEKGYFVGRRCLICSCIVRLSKFYVKINDANPVLNAMQQEELCHAR